MLESLKKSGRESAIKNENQRGARLPKPQHFYRATIHWSHNRVIKSRRLHNSRRNKFLFLICDTSG
jgi:hypothetical protein